MSAQPAAIPESVSPRARAPRSASVERKLRGIVMVATAVALLLAGAGVALIETVTVRQQLLAGLTTQADVLAENSPAVILFDQAEDATNTLRTLRVSARLEAAAIFREDGTPYAGYQRQGRMEGIPRRVPPLGALFVAGGMEVTRPVIHQGGTVGFVWLRSDLEDLHARFRRYMWFGVILLPCSFGVAAWLGSRLQRSVTEPILRLCESMRAVSERKDYTIRAQIGSDDEVGQLMEGFNRMLQRIGEQDSALKAERAQLALRVEERTGELRRANEEMTGANQRLQRAMIEAERLAQAAEAASRSKSEFLAAVSHELRTPMNGVLGFTNLLIDSSLGAEQREFAEIIRNSGQTLLTLINDILDFSKIEAGKLAIERLPFDPARALEDVAELLGPRADEKHLEIALAIDPSLPSRLVGDPARFRQVLMNLVGNAIKFTDRGHVLIEAGSAARLAPHHPGIPEILPDGFLFCVTDTGIGIPADKQALIFERFTQADSSTTRKYGGTGLGLAISRRLTELMGGTIGLHSEAGRGSTFWFQLPGGLECTAEEPASDPPPDIKGIRVLIVDDVEVNRRVLHEQLRVWGIDHTAAESGARALELLGRAAREGHPYQVALLDYLMPDMDGLALGRQIQADPALAATRLVMITSGSQRTEAGAFLAEGFAACLLKPVVRPRVLADTILAAASAPTAAPAVASEVQPSVAVAPPVEKAPEAPETPETPSSPPAADPLRVGTSPPRPAAGNRILLAEDNRTNQIYAARLLQKLGWQVDLAENGAVAVAKVRDAAYRLILMDCQMPEMNGYDASREIRRLEAGSGIRVPIIALTAHALVGERERCLEAGMDDYLAKPFQKSDLDRVLAQWVGAAGCDAAAQL